MTPFEASSEGDMEYANGVRRLGRAARREAPPHWAVVAVKICVAGILLMPWGCQC